MWSGSDLCIATSIGWFKTKILKMFTDYSHKCIFYDGSVCIFIMNYGSQL